MSMPFCRKLQWCKLMGDVRNLSPQLEFTQTDTLAFSFSAQVMVLLISSVSNTAGSLPAACEQYRYLL